MRARARVQITVEVNLAELWGGNCSIDQLHKQAAEAAIGQVNKLIYDASGVQIIGHPKVTGVLTEE